MKFCIFIFYKRCSMYLESFEYFFAFDDTNECKW